MLFSFFSCHLSCIWLQIRIVVFLLCCILTVWRVGLPVDGEPEVGRELQPAPSSDREACGAVCQLSEDWPADGLPQRVLRSSQTAGTSRQPKQINVSYPEWRGRVFLLKVLLFTSLEKSQREVLSTLNLCMSFCISLPGLLCGDFVSNWDRHTGSSHPPNPSVVAEGHLPSRVCPQRPGPDESQVSKSRRRGGRVDSNMNNGLSWQNKIIQSNNLATSPCVNVLGVGASALLKMCL